MFPRLKAPLGIVTALFLIGPSATAQAQNPAAGGRNPETMCATQDAHRLEIKPGVGILHPGEDVYTRRAGGERVASCEIRARGRTTFQRYEAGKVVQRGFFLEGKRSGRWTDRGSVTIYAAGNVLQERPSSECDLVAKIHAIHTVYCPRATPFADMLSDFRTWAERLHRRGQGVGFDVYSSETSTPDSDGAYNAFPERSEINFAVTQFIGNKLTEFLCIPPGERKQRNCLHLVGAH